MKVAKWGNSLAVRLPMDVIDALDLKAGDDIEIRATEWRTFDAARKPTLEELFEDVKSLRGRMPKDFKFDREAANER